MKRTRQIFCNCLLWAVFLFSAHQSDAQLRLPSVLASGMVLQQNDSINFWGWAGPGEKVFVTTSWNNRTDSTLTTNMATWKLRTLSPAAGGPFTITIKSRNTITLTDVLVGEVWVCSGQSNMEWSYYNGTSDIAPAFATASNQRIRLFHVPKTAAGFPQDDLKAGWTSCDSTTIKSFSSVGYFFGRKLEQELNVPIGIINASWGGTPAETWTPEPAVLQNDSLKSAAAKIMTFPWWPSAAGQAYNAMIAPLTNFSIAGAIWYQGESNVGTYATYRRLFTTMIDQWRLAWKKSFPFYYVQIAPYKYELSFQGALLQEQQTRSMQHPNTGMVLTTDLVDSVTNIHPSRKKPVGERLANWALAETYHKTGFVYKSPSLGAVNRAKGHLVLQIIDTGGGLTSNGNEARGFYVSGEQESWYPAKVKIEKDRIILWSPDVKSAYHARYGFSNTESGNISSKEGLPLIPFRTDNWTPEQKPNK